MLGLLAALTMACWLPIVGWYSLAANQTHTHFAFEKIPGGLSSPLLRATLLLFLLLAFLYALGYRVLAAQRELSRFAKLSIVMLVIGPGLANLFLYPVGALDVFNYLVELKLTYGYGENPYLETFAAHRDDPYALPAFLINVPLFYGPVWLLAYGLPVAAVGFGSIVMLLGAVKLFNLLLLALTGMLIFRFHPENARGWLGVYCFLANPLVLFEGVGNAHNDVLMTLFLIAAVTGFARKSAFAGPFLALSALVKVFSAALAPLLLATAWRDRWGWRRFAATALLSMLVVLTTVTPFWGGGEMLDGLRRGTVRSQQMDHVSLLSLTQQAVRTRPTAAWFAPLFSFSLPGSGCVPRVQANVSLSTDPGAALPPCPRRQLSMAARKELVSRAGAILFAIGALLLAGAVARGRSVEAAAVDTLLLFCLLVTNLYPWYLIPIVALLALRSDRLSRGYLFTATALGLAYYPAYVFARFDQTWPELTIHLFLALFLTVPIVGFLGYRLSAIGYQLFLSRRVGESASRQERANS